MLTELGTRVVLSLVGVALGLALGQAVYRGLFDQEGPGIEIRVCRQVMGRDGVYAQECVDAR